MRASEPAPAPDASAPAMGASRYEVMEEIGRGGLARVFRARDRVDGREVAVKRLEAQPDPQRQARAQALFEREYHLLSQLAHPRIVQVFDYRGDGAQPFFTMELLDGGDLREVAPLPYDRACALIRDACSALSLIHSRRTVHRDVSPRNIRVAADGSGKLIDFGATAPMGPCQDAIGTPPNCPPEVLDRQTLDARSDLYSLGTSLYFALCGRNAYPARDFRHLRRLWQLRVAPPSEHVGGLPPALDDLVMELISLDPAARPDNAAEVMERLTAIASLPDAELALVPRAYLKTPTLVGRARPLSRVRGRLQGVRDGQGGAVLVSAASGMGRTRFVETCAVKGKLLGLSVLRAGLADAADGEYGTARSLVQQAFDAHPEQAQAAAGEASEALDHLLPEEERRSRETGAQPHSRLAIQQAGRAWFLALARTTPLVVVVDDLDRLDEPSAALLSILADAALGRAVMIIATTTEDALRNPSPGLRLFSDCSASVRLAPIKRADTHTLLSSVFGDVPNLDCIANHLHGVAQGSPRDVMHLAEHLVERKVARYEAGTWRLPPSLDPADVPESLARAFEDQVANLSEATRCMGALFGLTPDDRWDLPSVQRVTQGSSGAAVLLALDELCAARVVTHSGGAYALSQMAFAGPLTAPLDNETRLALHRRIAEEFARAGDTFRSVQHLLRAGEDTRALDLLVPFARASKEETSADVGAYHRFLWGLPRDYEESYRHAMDLCTSHGRPAADRDALVARLATAVAAKGGAAWELFKEVLDTCARAIGLDLLADQDPTLEPLARIGAAMRQAGARREQAGPRAFVFSPMEALRPLASRHVEALGIVSNNFDRRAWQSMPDLMPLAPLSPAFSVLATVSAGVGERLAGRMFAASELYSAMLNRLAQPDRAGLDPSYHAATCEGMHFVRGLLAGLIGASGAQEDAQVLDTGTLHRLGSRQLRMVHCLWQGDGEAADRFRREIEIEQVQTNVALHYEGMTTLAALVAVSMSDDYPRLHRMLPDVERFASQYPDWQPVLHFARGEQHRITGDVRKALCEHRKGLALARPGEDQLWACLAGSEVRCLLKLGETAEAIDRGLRYAELCDQNRLKGLDVYVHMPLAVGFAEHGDRGRGLELAEQTIAALAERGCSGVLMALAHQILARIHLRDGHHAAFDRAMAVADAELAGATTKSLWKRNEHLRRLANQHAQGEPEPAVDAGAEGSAIPRQITSLFADCASIEVGAQHTAELLADFCSATAVHVFVPFDDGMSLQASVGESEPPERLSEFVSDFVHAEAGTGADATATGDAAESQDLAPEQFVADDGRRYQAVLLAHHESQGFAITGVAMVADPEKDPGAFGGALSRFGLGTLMDAPRTVMTTHMLPADRALPQNRG